MANAYNYPVIGQANKGAPANPGAKEADTSKTQGPKGK